MARSSQTTTANTAYRNSTYVICVAGLFSDGNFLVALRNVCTTTQLQHGLANVRDGLHTQRPALHTTQDNNTDPALFPDVDEASQHTPPVATVIVPQAIAQVIRNAALPAGTAVANVGQQQQQSINHTRPSASCCTHNHTGSCC